MAQTTTVPESEKKSTFQKDSGSPVQFIRDNLLILLGGTLVLLLYFLPWLADSTLGIDTFIFIDNPGTTMNWLNIERPVMVLLHKLFYTSDELALFYCESMSYLLAVATMGLYSWIFFTKASVPCWQSVLFFLMMLIHPLMTEQFYFTLQMADIMAGFFLCGIALLLSWSRRMELWVAASILIALLLALYQSFAPFYISFCLLLFCLIWIRERKAGLRRRSRYYLTLGLRQLVIFAPAFVLERIVVRMFFSGPGGKDYLAAQSNWGKVPLSQVFATIFTHAKIMLTGETAFYPLAFPAGIVLFFLAGAWMIFKSGRRYGWQWFAAAGILLELSPLFLTVYLGNYPVARSILNLPLVSAGNFLLLFACLPPLRARLEKAGTAERILKAAAAVITLLFLNSQYYTTALMQYTSRMVKEDDEREARTIELAVLETAGYTTKPVVLIGFPEVRKNNGMIPLEIQTVGIFRQSYAGEPRYEGLNSAANEYMESLGIFFTSPDLAQIDAARTEAATMTVFPQEGSVRETETLVIVKLGNDEWYEFDRGRQAQQAAAPESVSSTEEEEY